MFQDRERQLERAVQTGTERSRVQTEKQRDRTANEANDDSGEGLYAHSKV